jgi:hypothetical protein
LLCLLGLLFGDFAVKKGIKIKALEALRKTHRQLHFSCSCVELREG